MKYALFFLRYVLYAILYPIPIYLLSFINRNINFYKYYTKFIFDNGFSLKYFLIKKSKKIDKGFIISNHVSGFDNMYDSYITKSTLLARTNTKYYHGFYYLIQKFYNMILLFDKNNTKRKKLYEDLSEFLQNHNRIIFYPEGTRVKVKYVDYKQLKKNVKYGLLKSIYENCEYPVQLFLSINKDQPFLGNNKTILSMYSEPFHPANYNTFTDFYNDIFDEWFKILSKLYCYENRLKKGVLNI